MSKHYLLLKSINKAYIWVVTRHQNGISALVSWDAISRETSLLVRRNVGCFLASERALHLGEPREVTRSSTRKETRGRARGGSHARSLSARRLCEAHWHTIKNTTGTSVLTCTTFLIVLLKRPSSCEEGNSNSFYKKHTQEKYVICWNWSW